MARQGVPAPYDRENAGELKKLLARFHPGSPLRLEGVMTHFSAADELDSSSFQRQFARLVACARLRGGGGADIPVAACGSFRHIAGRKRFAVQCWSWQKNTERGSCCAPASRSMDMRRALHREGRAADDSATILKPVLAWKTRVISTRLIPQGETVSYNETFRAERANKACAAGCGLC